MPNRGIIDRKLRFEFARDLEQPISHFSNTASLLNGVSTKIYSKALIQSHNGRRSPLFAAASRIG